MEVAQTILLSEEKEGHMCLGLCFFVVAIKYIFMTSYTLRPENKDHDLSHNITPMTPMISMGKSLTLLTEETMLNSPLIPLTDPPV